MPHIRYADITPNIDTSRRLPSLIRHCRRCAITSRLPPYVLSMPLMHVRYVIVDLLTHYCYAAITLAPLSPPRYATLRMLASMPLFASATPYITLTPVTVRRYEEKYS